MLDPILPELPIIGAIPELRNALAAGTSAVLQAPPGAGKTTVVPLALLDEPWLAGQKIILLEPRRLAARAAAQRMAAILDEDVGETIGYRIRLETRVGPQTRIEVVTEGVLTRILQNDPTLEGIGLLVFDEIHERNLHADLGLALALHSRELVRPELRILAMSATLEGEPLSRLLDDAPIITSEGRTYPIETVYLSPQEAGQNQVLGAPTSHRAIVTRTTRGILRALVETDGDILAFLPGIGEIRGTEAALDEVLDGDHREVLVLPLHGGLSRAEQDRALEPAPPGVRKVVLATSIAQTSLTIDGIRAVVDSGVMRVPRFSPRTGMDRLETIMVSRATADQRRGRAGRQGPGTCYRLWTEAEDRGLTPHDAPEILQADLAPLALELANWGITDRDELRWLDSPPSAALGQAHELLRALEAIDDGGQITPHGRRLARLGAHPRLGHLLLRAEELGLGRLGAELAALLAERDPFRPGRESSDLGRRDPDLRRRVEALRGARGALPPGYSLDRGTLHRARREARHWRRRLRVRDQEGGGVDDVVQTGLILAFAFPDRVGIRRADQPGRFLLRSGRGARLDARQALAGAEAIVAAELDDVGAEGRILLAAPIELDEIRRAYGDQIWWEESVTWDDEGRRTTATRRERLGALTLSEAPIREPDPERVLRALIDGVRAEGLEILPWTRESRQLQRRLIFMREVDPEWPDFSSAYLLEHLEEWLGPYLYGLRSAADLARLDLASILLNQLSWEERERLDIEAPPTYQVPSGSRIRIDYDDAKQPTLSVRLQELFGLTETPRIARGRVPLTLELLSPAQRPVQITRDLASFWDETYFEVRKDLRGRYPKHYWPDDPRTAQATRRTRPRGG